MAPHLATQQGKDQSSKSTTTWDAYGASMAQHHWSGAVASAGGARAGDGWFAADPAA
jgi:hypothetical protein